MWTLTITSQVHLLDGHSVPPLCTKSDAVEARMRGRNPYLPVQTSLGPAYPMF